MEQKGLNELSKEEFGKLFPVEIVPYDPAWPILFEKEKKLLLKTLGPSLALRIEHFGGTAVPGLASKPIIDIVLETPILTEFIKKEISDKMESIGYKWFWRVSDRFSHMMFAKGYFMGGIKEQMYHIHMGDATNTLWERLHFRDYLRENPQALREYEDLKYKLAKKYKYDRDGYSFSKTDFITDITNKAIKQAHIKNNKKD